MIVYLIGLNPIIPEDKMTKTPANEPIPPLEILTIEAVKTTITVGITPKNIAVILMKTDLVSRTIPSES